jgi:murein DD-endopeptidase MepM/ murein hydrolase activator NlpD
MRRWIAALSLMVLSLALMGNERPPWRARRRPMPHPNRIARARIALSDWPPEPRTPERVDPARFARALQAICDWMPDERAARYTGWVLENAEAFEVDPFLLGALIYREGRCRSDAEDGHGHRGSGTGLTLIDHRMYWENLRGGTLRYFVRADDAWVERERTVDRFGFGGPRLRQPEPNIYFAAALLSAWRDQHATVDATFEQHPHRHFVSHWIWGDRVRSDRQEDRILLERRRLLEYYGAHDGPPPVIWGGVTFGCPLDGCPRVISSWLGSERDGGARHHRGVDVESLPGEPVRAIADGLVVFAGVDLPGGQRHRQLRTREQYEAIDDDALGAGGRYVCVRTRREGDLHSVRHCYMHLEQVTVAYGDRVARGDQVGTVGRTGMRRSAAHLHLEMSTDRLEDPSEILYGLLLGNRDTDPLPPGR